jgi:SAM-dependent methyltransferase
VSIDRQVAEHYTHGNLAEAILGALAASGKNAQVIAPADLAPVDEMHIGGRQATAEFAGRLGIQPDLHLLDVGCGIGGPSRLFADEHGCQVTGVDLTEEFCQVAALLSARVGLAERIQYRHASALALPFEEAAFDGAYSIHAAMNIADKERLYAEIGRVVKPGGVFGLYDVLQGPGGAPRFPVPWAEEPSTSFLVTAEELCDLLAAAGFEVVASRDRSARGLAFMAETRARLGEGAPPPLGPQIIMGPNYREKIANLRANLEQARIAPWEMICRRL